MHTHGTTVRIVTVAVSLSFSVNTHFSLYPFHSVLDDTPTLAALA
jgi:hypothetical protein